MILVYEIMLDRFLRACLVFLFSTLEACKSTAQGKPEGRNPGLGRFNIKLARWKRARTRTSRWVLRFHQGY